jgi:ligand-binding sensor domain-containing protein
MADRVTLRIFDIVGGPVWVSTDDGQKVYDKITAAFKADRAVELVVRQRENLITAFLNAAIGQLHGGQYDEPFLHSTSRLRRHLLTTTAQCSERAIENAKRYFANRQAYDQAWQEVVDEDEE